MSEPNIFDFATKELSQDAFLCWIFSWGKQEYENDNSELHQFAKRMLFDITKKNDLILEEISRQQKHIDILLKLKDPEDQKYAVIIEDKIGTQEHNEQIATYIKEIAPSYEKNIFIVYFKTGFTSNQEKRYLKERYPQIVIYDHNEIYNKFQNCPNHYILNQWLQKFQNDYQDIKNYKKNLNYEDIFYKKDTLKMQCALDHITENIREKTNYKSSYWYIVDQGRTSHICIYEHFTTIAEKYEIHNAIYVMFRKKEYNFVVKQHIYQKTSNEKKHRILIKDYDKLPMDVINIKEKIKDNICNSQTDWEIKRSIEKDNLMILQKSFTYKNNIHEMLELEKNNIERIKDSIESILN